MKERLISVVKKYLIILGICVGYLVFVLITDIGIPCPIYKLTGFQCPGCGISRMFTSLFKLDFISAFTYNPFLLITGPIILAYIAFSEVKYIKTGDGSMGKLNVIMWLILASAIVFGVLRNIF